MYIKNTIIFLLCFVCATSLYANRKPKLDYSDNALSFGVTAPIGSGKDMGGITGRSLLSGIGVTFDTRTLADNYNLGLYFSTSLYSPRMIHGLQSGSAQYGNADYDSIVGFDFFLGGYRLQYHSDTIRIPLAVGVHCGYLYDKLSLTNKRVTTDRLALGIGIAGSAEYTVSKYFAVSATLKLFYDMYMIQRQKTAATSTAFTKTTTKTTQGSTSDIWISPSLGFVIHYGE